MVGKQKSSLKRYVGHQGLVAASANGGTPAGSCQAWVGPRGSALRRVRLDLLVSPQSPWSSELIEQPIGPNRPASVPSGFGLLLWALSRRGGAGRRPGLTGDQVIRGTEFCVRPRFVPSDVLSG